MRVDKAQEAVEVASRVIDVLMAKVGQNVVEHNENSRDGSPEAQETNEAYDRGFRTMHDLSDVKVTDLDLASVVKAVFPGEAV